MHICSSVVSSLPSQRNCFVAPATGGAGRGGARRRGPRGRRALLAVDKHQTYFPNREQHLHYRGKDCSREAPPVDDSATAGSSRAPAAVERVCSSHAAVNANGQNIIMYSGGLGKSMGLQLDRRLAGQNIVNISTPGASHNKINFRPPSADLAKNTEVLNEDSRWRSQTASSQSCECIRRAVDGDRGGRARRLFDKARLTL
ncbi:hypothetical protein EVAR_2479_1 [Eumeta japonica]|uniref:Uncharacterized protein n=1 Tax=Eumeta variegata TaxID=151549 RepID=A0A4C1SP48_EUMVA|nr:hypothetical protein EVAR_2479_1 [Eumeta japonica]